MELNKTYGFEVKLKSGHGPENEEAKEGPWGRESSYLTPKS